MLINVINFVFPQTKIMLILNPLSVKISKEGHPWYVRTTKKNRRNSNKIKRNAKRKKEFYGIKKKKVKKKVIKQGQVLK